MIPFSGAKYAYQQFTLLLSTIIPLKMDNCDVLCQFPDLDVDASHHCCYSFC
jgi:hypothetical protein